MTLSSAQRRWGWGAAGALLVLALWTGWLWRHPRVDAVELQSAPLVRSLQFSARVATLSRVEIGSTITGRVQAVVVEEGARVRRGDVLLRLESDELVAALTQAVAAERQAAARLAGLRSTGRTAAQAALAQTDATVRAARAELTRTEQLVAQGFLSASRLDEVRRSLEVAQAQQVSARAQTRANEETGTDLVQAQAQLAVAQATTQAAQARLAQATLLAPADAQVLLREVEPGQIVQPGKALLGLALDGPTQISAQVDERFLDQLQTGQIAQVVADAFAGQPLAARVLSIAPSVDAQRGAIEVRLALDAPAPAFLREDMTVSVEVETARRERALVLPLAALRTALPDGSAAVMVSDQGRARSRAVKLGLRTLDAAEVVEGLAEGDVVLIGGNPQADAGVRVRRVPWQPGQPLAPGAAAPDAGAALTNAMGR
ncbi:efflux RND transporter periplasmic adaptor subunit [Hydrogenophaga sp. IBVHS1]|uniref:efflux RND transporter periplasmic adaptor subunit n=1 Tax=unclassified Hydrogenophaga TaxID=2610897 RepID=UPI000A2D0D3E|nr:efflux RND transporter periplasmic adaptor subunit [Hydrogenophaga sp. IBVHS1]OSZ74104.1 efflux transporter periplasmic adaptor subunit [Hydrogenophaga sp. IBVHS1]